MKAVKEPSELKNTMIKENLSGHDLTDDYEVLGSLGIGLLDRAMPCTAE